MASRGIFVGFNGPNLKYAEEDALKLSERWENLGCDFMHFKAQRAQNVLEYAGMIAAQARETDSLLFFFSGHGLIDLSKGPNALCLVVDSRSQRDEYLLRVEYLVDKFSDAKSKNKLLILDCCNSGTADRILNGRSIPGLRVLTSARGLQRAHEIEQTQSGFLRWALMKALEEDSLAALVDHEGRLQIDKLYARLHELSNSPEIRDGGKSYSVNLFGNQADNVSVFSLHAHVAKRIRNGHGRASRFDWGKIDEANPFFGRTPELKELKEWICDARARIVLVYGLRGIGKTQLSGQMAKKEAGEGGIGKTKLTYEFAEHNQAQFEFIFWRRLTEAPPLIDILLELILHILGGASSRTIPTTTNERIDLVLKLLQEYRCLVVFDNFDTLLESQGKYRPDRGDYGHLLSEIASVPHQSCLLMTSRQKPPKFDLLAQNSAVKLMTLRGIAVDAAKELFADLGAFHATDDQWSRLTEYYGGNPLALKLAASHIREVFDSDIGEFLEHGKGVFGSVKDLLDWHWERLTIDEQTLCKWFVVNREPVGLRQLREDAGGRDLGNLLPETLEGLMGKIPVEKAGPEFGLQPVLMEHFAEIVVKQCTDEILSGDIQTFADISLIKASAKTYVREAQERLLLKPIIDNLTRRLSGRKAVHDRIIALVSSIRSSQALAESYAPGNCVNLLCHLGTPLEGADFSELVIRQAYLQDWDLPSVDFSGAAFDRTLFTETIGGVFCVKFNSQGTLLATADASETITLWEMPKGIKTKVLNGHESWVRSVDFSPSGRLLASVGDDRNLCLWTVDGELMRSAQHEHHALRAVCFRDEKCLATAGLDGAVKFWSVPDLTFMRTVAVHPGGVRAVSFSKDGRWLASGGDDCVLIVTSADGGERIAERKMHSKSIRSVVFSPDSRWLATGGDDAMIFLISTADWTVAQEFPGHQDQIRALEFDHQSTRLVSVSLDGTVRIWNLDGEKRHVQLRHKGHDRLWSVVFTADGESIVTGSFNKSIRVWSSKRNEILRVLQGYTNGIKSVSWTTSGQVVSGSDDGYVRIWDQASGTNERVKERHRSIVWCVAGVAGRGLIASASDDNSVMIFDAESLEVVVRLEGHNYAVTGVCFSPCGEYVFSGSVEQRVIRWSVPDGEFLNEWTAPARVWSVSHSASGGKLAVTCDNGGLYLLDASTMNLIESYELAGGFASKSAWHPAKDLLAVATELRGILLIEPGSGRAPSHIDKVDAIVGDVAFLEGGRRLAGGARDGKLHVWNTEDGALLQSVSAHEKRIWCMSTDPSSGLLATASEDETIGLWDPKTLGMVRRLRIQRPYEGMRIRGAKGLTSAQKDTLISLGATEKAPVKGFADAEKGQICV